MRLNKVKLEDVHYPKALAIWERSVIATHDFLKAEDRIALKQDIPTYFQQVEAYLWFDGQEAVGFSGTHDANLEMLFIDPKYFHQGYGSEILHDLIQQGKVKYVDVNQATQVQQNSILNMALKYINHLKQMPKAETILFYI